MAYLQNVSETTNTKRKKTAIANTFQQIPKF
jgi:hypothetical protein